MTLPPSSKYLSKSFAFHFKSSILARIVIVGFNSYSASKSINILNFNVFIFTIRMVINLYFIP